MRVTLLPVCVLLLSACGGTTPPLEHPSESESSDAPSSPVPIVAELPPATEGGCGPFDGPSASTSTSSFELLAGRLTITAPSDAVSSVRAHNIMAAATGDDQETRLVIDREDSRIVVFVFENFTEPPTDLIHTAARFEGERIGDGVVSATRLPSGLDVVLGEPSGVVGPPGGVLVDDAWVCTPEGTLVFAAVFVTPNVDDAPTSCRAFARRILTSLAPGSRTLDLAARTVSLEEGLRIDLPARHVITRDAGPDFSVYRVRRVIPFRAPEEVLGIYIGSHPSFDPEGTQSTARLLGQDVTFFTVEGSTTLRRDALVEMPNGAGVVHAFLEAPTSASLEALTRIAETMTVAP